MEPLLRVGDLLDLQVLEVCHVDYRHSGVALHDEKVRRDPSLVYHLLRADWLKLKLGHADDFVGSIIYDEVLHPVLVLRFVVVKIQVLLLLEPDQQGRVHGVGEGTDLVDGRHIDVIEVSVDNLEVPL